MSKVTPQDTQEVKTNQPSSSKPVVISSAQPKKIELPARYSNSNYTLIINKKLIDIY